MFERIKNTIGLRTKEASATARDPKKVQVTRLGQPLISGGRAGEFEDSPVDLTEIGRAYFTDSYIRRAVDKHAGLLFKNGWEITGKNDAAVEYVWTRLKLMAEATSQSIDSLLSEIGDNLVLYSNAYLVKARQSGKNSVSGVNAVGYTGNKPIAGYFSLPAQLVRVQRDESGNITAYEQQNSSGGGEGTTFNPEDVVHFHYKRPSGRAYGVPMIYNVLDDVKLLRQIEENVARLIYRNLFPLHLYKVGLATPGYEATDDEIEELREQIRSLPSDGALVVPERHNIEVVGSQGQAIDASSYLQYFRERVFSGLFVSDTVMGISGTANKSTSDNQSSDLNDSVKDFQKTFADIFKFHVINEILFEGGFDPILNPDDEVEFVFMEIEFDAKIKRENHVAQLFMQNTISFEEMRQLMGRDTTVDESRFYYHMFPEDTDDTTTSDSEAAANLGNNLDQPENQSGKQLSPGNSNESNKTISVSESLTDNSVMVTLQEELHISDFTKQCETYWSKAQDDVQERIRRGEDIELAKALTTSLIESLMTSHGDRFIEQSFLLGYQRGLSELGSRFSNLLKEDVAKAVRLYSNSFSKLVIDLTDMIGDCYETSNPVAHIAHAFTANKYRIAFIAKTIAFEAYNYGIALSASKCGQKKVYVEQSMGCCKKCMTAPSEIHLVGDWRKNIPPHHTNCECKIVLTNK